MPMPKRALVPLAAGFEEIEAFTIVDILRRAGVEVVVAGVAPGLVTGRSGIAVRPDRELDGAAAGPAFDLVFLPGGMPGSTTLRDDPRIISILQRAHDGGGWVAAICAAPIALERAGLLAGREATCHPGMAEELPGPSRNEARVVISGRVVTSRAPGTAMELAFALVRILRGDAKAAEVNTGVLAAL
ncbi:MAG: DJ-1/PfpI family protein [Proteobacteria bacterium]|nr:DJ-1/PfpI family protein [Pseudomonadota bacterium]